MLNTIKANDVTNRRHICNLLTVVYCTDSEAYIRCYRVATSNKWKTADNTILITSELVRMYNNNDNIYVYNHWRQIALRLSLDLQNM